MKKYKFLISGLSVLTILAISTFLVSCNSGSSSDQNTETINGIVVPPDPGEAGKETLAGIDSNDNGVRDDVERAIVEDYGKDAEQYNLAFEHAQSLNYLYQDTVPDEAVRDYLKRLECLMNESNFQAFSFVSRSYKNTNERSERSSSLFGGRSLSGGITCD